jgi:hypothetical protein
MGVMAEASGFSPFNSFRGHFAIQVWPKLRLEAAASDLWRRLPLGHRRVVKPKAKIQADERLVGQSFRLRIFLSMALHYSMALGGRA